MQLTTSSEQVHRRVLRKSSDGKKIEYFRFQVERVVDEICQLLQACSSYSEFMTGVMF